MFMAHAVSTCYSSFCDTMYSSAIQNRTAERLRLDSVARQCPGRPNTAYFPRLSEGCLVCRGYSSATPLCVKCRLCIEIISLRDEAKVYAVGLVPGGHELSLGQTRGTSPAMQGKGDTRANARNHADAHGRKVNSSVHLCCGVHTRGSRIGDPLIEASSHFVSPAPILWLERLPMDPTSLTRRLARAQTRGGVRSRSQNGASESNTGHQADDACAVYRELKSSLLTPRPSHEPGGYGLICLARFRRQYSGRWHAEERPVQHILSNMDNSSRS